MEEKFKNLPLRNGVGIVVLNKENKVFVGKRIDNQKNFWQMPQGGVDDGEDHLSAAYRELEEETGIRNVKLLKELSNSTSSLNAALEAISNQNKQLVKEITDQKENITFP